MKYLFGLVIVAAVVGYLLMAYFAHLGYGSQATFDTYLMLVAAALAFTGFGWWLEEVLVRPRRQAFKAKGIAMSVTPDGKELHIRLGDNQEPSIFDAGTLVYSGEPLTNSYTSSVTVPTTIHTVTGSTIATVNRGGTYETTRTVKTGQWRLTFGRVDLSKYWPGQKVPPRAKSQESITLPASVAKAADRWVRAHRKSICFDPRAADKRIGNERDAALKDARHRCAQGKTKGGLEEFSWVESRPSTLAAYMWMAEDGSAALLSAQGIQRFSVDQMLQMRRYAEGHNPVTSIPVPGHEDLYFSWSDDMVRRIERLARQR